MKAFSNRGSDFQPDALRLRLNPFCLAPFGFVSALIVSFGMLPHFSRAAESENAVADFSGYWERPEIPSGAAVFYPVEGGPVPVGFVDEAGDIRQGVQYLGDYDNPILQPHAAEAVRAQHETYRRGDAVWSPWALCWPSGIPLAFNKVWAVQFLQSHDEVEILYQMSQSVRRVYLNEEHPDDPEVSWFGHSVGHYEGGNTLVIDTIAQDPRAPFDRFGTPKSEAMHVVERYRISDDGRRLDVELSVEDPNIFTEAWAAKFSYVRMPPLSGEGPREPIFPEYICPDNNRDAAGGTYPIPMETTPDF